MAGTEDFSGVVVTFNQPSYTPGQSIVATLSGTAKNTVAGTAALALQLSLVASPSGNAGQVNVTGPNVQTSIVTNETFACTSVVDATGRVWTIAPGGLSLSATA